MLINIQRPGSIFVATVDKWKKLNRTIKIGSRPLIILKPFGPVDFVFEISDTEGDDVPEDILNPFKTRGKIDNDIYYYRLRDNLIKYGIKYSSKEYGNARAGEIISIPREEIKIFSKNNDSIKTVTVLYHIVLNSIQNLEESFSTLVHELGHLFCGHLGKINNICEERKGLDKNICEFEAESVAWIVCERHGIINKSAQYLNSYLSTHKTIHNVSIESILKAAGMIENMISRPVAFHKFSKPEDAKQKSPKQ